MSPTYKAPVGFLGADKYLDEHDVKSFMAIFPLVKNLFEHFTCPEYFEHNNVGQKIPPDIQLLHQSLTDPTRDEDLDEGIQAEIDNFTEFDLVLKGKLLASVSSDIRQEMDRLDPSGGLIYWAWLKQTIIKYDSEYYGRIQTSIGNKRLESFSGNMRTMLSKFDFEFNLLETMKIESFFVVTRLSKLRNAISSVKDSPSPSDPYSQVFMTLHAEKNRGTAITWKMVKDDLISHYNTFYAKSSTAMVANHAKLDNGKQKSIFIADEADEGLRVSGLNKRNLSGGLIKLAKTLSKTSDCSEKDKKKLQAFVTNLSDASTPSATIICYKCGKEGHKSNVCRSKSGNGKGKGKGKGNSGSSKGKGSGKGGKGSGNKGSGKSQGSGKGSGNGYSAGVECYNCGKKGHYANVCWNPPNGGGGDANVHSFVTVMVDTTSKMQALMSSTDDKYSYVDTCATHVMTGDATFFEETSKIKTRVLFGDMVTGCSVTAIGILTTKFKSSYSASDDFHTLNFKDAYFCEGMSKDLLSMKVLIDKGCEFDMKRMRLYLPGLTDRYFKMIWKHNLLAIQNFA